MKKTKYDVYGTFDDLIKLYRRAIKKGYTAGTLDEIPNGDEVVQIIEYGKKLSRVEISPQRWAFSKEFNCEVMIPAKAKVVECGPKSRRLSCKHAQDNRKVPKVLIYRNYAERKVASPDFELFRLTLERDYE